MAWRNTLFYLSLVEGQKSRVKLYMVLCGLTIYSTGPCGADFFMPSQRGRSKLLDPHCEAGRSVALAASAPHCEAASAIGLVAGGRESSRRREPEAVGAGAGP